MATFNISLVLDTVEPTDEQLGRIFEAVPDAVPSAVGGVVTLSAPVEALDPESAFFLLLEAVEAVIPGAMPLRLDQDLVSIPDIAERTKRSRESIRLLVEGRRGPGGFPPPIGIVGGGTRVWPWASIVEWFERALGEDLGERGVPPEVAAVIDAHLASRRGFPGRLPGDVRSAR